MAQVNYVLTDVTYESSVNPNMKFSLIVRAYDATDQTGDTVDNRFFINGAVDGKDIMSDCLSTANQPQSNHCVLRSENDWVISGDDYHLIEAIAAACDAAAIADIEETVKDTDNNDVIVKQCFRKKPNEDTVMAEVYVEGAVVWRTSFKLEYNVTNYDDNDISVNKISNVNKPNLSAAVEQTKTAVANDDVVRLLVTPDPISGVYTAGRISYKYTTNWDFRAEQNEQDKLWHAYVTFSLLYGTDDVSLEFRKRDFDFSKYNLYRAEAAMQGVMDGLIDKMYDMFDKMSGVKFAVNTNGDPQKPVVYENEERKILQPDDYDQLVTAFSRPKGEKTLVVEAEAAAANYDGTVRCLLQMTNGILIDKTGATWTSEGSPEATQAEAKFGYGLLLTDASRMKCGNVTLGGADITVDFFAHIPSSSAAGRIFYWGDSNTFLELRYDSSEKNVIMACKEGSVSSKQEGISYGAETVCDQNFHYAITYSFASKELILFVDGVKMGAVSNVTIKRIKAEVTLGELTRDFSVTLDEFRVSDGLNRWPVPKRDPGKIVDAAGGEWEMRKGNHSRYTVIPSISEINSDKPEFSEVEDNTAPFPDKKVIQFNGTSSFLAYTTPVMAGGQDFCIDWWFKVINYTEGLFSLSVGNYNLHCHKNSPDSTDKSYYKKQYYQSRWSYVTEKDITSYCIHDTGTGSVGVFVPRLAIQLNHWHHIAVCFKYVEDESGQPNQKKSYLVFFLDGHYYGVMKASNTLMTQDVFSLLIGEPQRSTIRFSGCIDEFRITVGRWPFSIQDSAIITDVSKKADENTLNRLTKAFEPPTTRYDIDQEAFTTMTVPDKDGNLVDKQIKEYTKALLRASAVFGNNAPSSSTDVSNPNRVFTPPTQPYDAIVNEAEAFAPKEFYVPLVPYFDDSNLTAVEHLPRQKEPYPEYDALVHEPEWLYYDPNNIQLEISGILSGINAQTYYAFFEPKAGYCWRDGSTTKKRVPWYIRKVGVGQMPRQDEPLVYNAAEQDVNLVNFDAATMVLSGRVRAMVANTIDTPYYYCTVTLKDNLAWPTGTTEPYEVPWEIVPQPVTPPVLSETSSLSFVYDGTEQGPVFVYDSDLVAVKGDAKAVDANVTDAGIVLTEEYCVTFSLKDTQNYCWNTTETEFDISDTEDISFFWHIKRRVIQQPSWSGGPFVYNGTEQGPTVEGLDETYCQISGHRATEPGYYIARVVLTDPDNCEWPDGTTGDVVYNWEIPMQKGQISLVPNTLNLQAHKGTPVPSATVQVTRLGSGKVTVTENPKVRVEIDNTTLTVYGLDTTYPNSVTLSVSVETGHGFDYEGVSAPLTITVLRWLDALTWKEIAELATEDELLNGYSFISDSKAVPSCWNNLQQQCKWDHYKKSTDYADELTNPYCRVVLIGVDHNAAYEGDGRAHFLFYNNADNSLGYLKGDNLSMHSGKTTFTGGWRNSNIRRRFYSFSQYDFDRETLPDDMVRYTVPVLKWTDNIGNGVNNKNNVFPTLEWLTSFSEKEVYGTNTYSNAGEDVFQERYAYFSLNPGDTERDAYSGDNAVLVALRSPFATDTKKDIFINTKGVLDSTALTGQFSSDGRDSVLLFTVADKRPDSLFIPSIDQHIVSLLHLKVPSEQKAWIVDECKGFWRIAPNPLADNTVFYPIDLLLTNTDEHSTARGYNWISDATLSFTGDVNTASLCCAAFYAGTVKPIKLNGGDFTLDLWFAHSNNDIFLFAVKGLYRNIRVYVVRQQLFCWLTDEIIDDDSPSVPAYRTTLVSASKTWHHCALMCKATKLYLFLDGKGELIADNYTIQKGIYSFYVASDPKVVTSHDLGLELGDWHFSELRIVNGVGVYDAPTSNGQQVFTPPTARYTNTEMLMYDHTIEGVHLSLLSTEPVKTLNVTQHSGPLFVHSSAPDIVAAYTGHDSSLNCDTVTLEGVSAGTAIVTIYTKDTALTYGDIRTIEVTCDTSIAFKTLANCQPSEIRSIVKKGSATKAWALGDKTADISLSGTVNGKQISQTVKATIIGFDHNKQKESNGQFSLHLMLDPIEDIFVMNDEAVTEGGWKSSKMHNTTCAEIYAALPAAWKSVVTPCTKYSDNNGTIDINDAISSTEDNIWILSNYEVTGTVIASGHTITAFEGEYQKQYDYFKTAANQPSDTWLRTPEIKGITFVSKGVPTKTVFCFMISDYSAAELLPDNLCSFTNNNFVEYDGNMHYPEEDGIVRYFANAEHPTLYRQYYVFSGDISAQKSGYYFLRIKPAPGYLWNDGTATEVPVAWTILPADSTITPDKESLRAYCKNNYQDSVAISRKATTTLEVTGYDTSLISVTVNSNRVTVTALATGKTEITVTSPTDGNYKTVSVALPVTASKVGELASLTPAQIQAAVIAGYAPLAWDPGDVTAPITVSGMFAGQDISGFYRAFILSCEHNTKNEGKHLHLCLGKEREGNKIIAFGKISLGSTNGGWQNSALRTQIQGLTACFPKAWRDVITNVCTKYSNTNVSGQSNTTRDKIWLLAQEEIFSYPNNNIKQYDYFAYGNKAIAYRQDYPSVIATLGTRTVAATAPDSWVGVDIQGKETVIPSTQKVALLPCFAIGTTKESPGLTVNPESIVTKVGDTVNVTVTVSADLPFTVTGYDEEIISVDAATCTVSALSIGRTYIVVSTEETDTYAQDSVTIPVTVAAADKTDPVVTFSNSIFNVWKNNTAPLTIDVTGGDIFSVTSEDITVATVIKKGSYYSVAGINDGNTNIVVDVRGDLSHNNVIKKIPVHVGAQPVTLSTLTEAASNLLINNPTYNGQEWNLTRDDIIAGYNQRYHALSGDITATNHSPTDYFVQVTPQVGFQWFDKTTETKNLPWNVNKATGILSGTDVVVLTKTTRETVTETYTITEGSTLSVKNNSHSSLVTVTVNGNKVTFTSSCSSNATANVTLQVTETNNYTSTELTVEVTVRDSALEVIPAIAGKDKLFVSKAAVTYDKNTTLTVDSSWITNFSNDYHRLSKVAKYADNTETVINNKKIKDAGTYRIYVAPAAGYAWDNTNDVDPVRLEYTINRKPIAAADEPVQSTTITLKTTGSTMPTADDFDYYKDQCIPATPFCSSQTTAGTFTGEDGAFFIPTSNYCWSDGSITAKSFPWTISSLVLLAKPTITTTSFVYDGTEKDPGIVTPDGMATYVTVTMQHKAPIACANPIPYSSDTVLTEKEKASGIKEKLIDDAIPVYRQTSAGTYIFTFSINDVHAASWANSSTDSVILEYTINRAEIAEADEPAVTGDFPVAYIIPPGSTLPSVELQSPTFTAATEANVGTDKKYTKGEILQQNAPGTYTAQFLVNGNYKWRKVAGVDDPYAPKEVPWKIVKADGFVTTDTVHSKSLTNLNYEVPLTSISSNTLDFSVKQGAYKYVIRDNKFFLQILQTGTTIASVTTTETNNFKETTVDLEFNLTLVKETEKTSLAFIHNLFHSLVWERILDGQEALTKALSFATNNKISSLSVLYDQIMGKFSELHSNLNNEYPSGYGFSGVNSTTGAVTVANIPRINRALKLLKDYFGIVMDSTFSVEEGKIKQNIQERDSGSILGSAYNSTIPDLPPFDVLTETGSLKTYPNPLTQVINNTTFIFPEENKNVSSGSLEYKENQLIKGLYTWWGKQILDIIKQVYDISLDAPQSSAGVVGNVTVYDKNDKIIAEMKDTEGEYIVEQYDANTVYVNFESQEADEKGTAAAWAGGQVLPHELHLEVANIANGKENVYYTYGSVRNLKDYNRPHMSTHVTVTINKVALQGWTEHNSQILLGSQGEPIDLVFLHEITHGVMHTCIVYTRNSKTSPIWFGEGTADLLPGIDHSHLMDIAVLADGNPTVLSARLGGSIREGLEATHAVYGAKIQLYSYCLSNFIFGYLCKQWRAGAFDDTPSSPVTTVTKPTVSSSTFTYNGSPVSITVPNNIMTVANVTMKKKLPLTFSYAASVRLKVGNESITLPYNLDDKSTTGFDSSFTDIELSSSYNFKETNAGVYQLTFTLKDTATTKWADNTTAPVTVEFTINRAAITTTDKPVLSPTDYTYNGQAQTPTCAAATTANLDKKYTMEVWEESAVNTTEDPNYTAFFFPTMNYKWGFSVYSKDPFGFEALPWYIVASDNPSGGGGSSGNTDTVNYPHLRDPNNVNTEWYPANPSFEINLTTTEEGFSKTLYCDTLSDFKWSVNVPNSDIIKVKTNSNLLTILCFKYGTYELKWKIKKATGSGVSEGSIPVNCNPVFVTVEQKKPWTFITNFLHCLVWGNTAWYIGDYNYSSGKIVNVYPIGGIQSLDDAVNIVTHGELKSTQAVLDKMKEVAGTFTASNVNNVFKEQYGMDLENTDIGTLWGFDMGASNTQIGMSGVVPETGSVESAYPSSPSLIEGVKFIWPDQSTLTDKQNFIIRALDTWWIRNALVLIRQYYNLVLKPAYNTNFAAQPEFKVVFKDTSVFASVNSTGDFHLDNAAIVKDGYFVYGNNWEYKTAAPSTNSNYWGQRRVTSWQLEISNSIAEKINMDSDGTVSGNVYPADQAILHEMVHGVIFSNIHGHMAQPKWFRESIADLMMGNDFRSDLYKTIAKSSTRLQQIYEEEYQDENDPYVFGVLLMKYLIKHFCIDKTVQPLIPT